jgi:hypothetical protein
LTITQLSVNVSKSIVLSICSKLDLTQLDYCINGLSARRQISIADLDVTIISDLSFYAHVNHSVSDARQRLIALSRGFLTRNVNIMRRALIAYVPPGLNIIVLLGSFTKRLPSISSQTYPERLALLNVESFELRMLRADLICCFKNCNNLTPFDPNEVFLIYIVDVKGRSGSIDIILKLDHK